MIKIESINFLNQHCEFNSPYDCYVILAVSRKKETPEITNSQEIVFREVIKNPKDIIRKYNKIKAQVTNYRDENGNSFPFYIYISLNARCSIKAVFALRKKMDDWLYQSINGVDLSRMFKKTYGHFYSELMRKECRSKHTKYFMIDCDDKTPDFIQKFEQDIRKITDIHCKQETKNGYHYKVKPFDIRKLPDTMGLCEVKKDANFFIEHVQNETKRS